MEHTNHGNRPHVLPGLNRPVPDIVIDNQGLLRAGLPDDERKIH